MGLSLGELAKRASSGHNSHRLHPRPRGIMKKLRIEGGPVAAEHKEAGRALATKMASEIRCMRENREQCVDDTRRTLKATIKQGFQQGAHAKGQLKRLEQAEERLGGLPVFLPRSAFVVPEAQSRDFVTLLGCAKPNTRRAMAAAPRSKPYARHQLNDAAGLSRHYELLFSGGEGNHYHVTSMDPRCVDESKDGAVFREAAGVFVSARLPDDASLSCEEVARPNPNPHPNPSPDPDPAPTQT